MIPTHQESKFYKDNTHKKKNKKQKTYLYRSPLGKQAPCCPGPNGPHYLQLEVFYLWTKNKIALEHGPTVHFNPQFGFFFLSCLVDCFLS